MTVNEGHENNAIVENGNKLEIRMEANHCLSNVQYSNQL